MTATCTFDIFASLDGFGSFAAPGAWGGYWGKQGAELLERRLAVESEEQRLLLGAGTLRLFARMLGPAVAAGTLDRINARMRALPTTVISSTLEEPLDWPDATVVRGDAVEVVARLKEESDVPLRSHGSLTLNRALLAAGLVDRLRLTVFPVITGQTGTSPVLAGLGDFDLELLEARTLDGHIQELTYRPTARAW